VPEAELQPNAEHTPVTTAILHYHRQLKQWREVRVRVRVRARARVRVRVRVRARVRVRVRVPRALRKAGKCRWRWYPSN